jgi:hypothetical protein
MAFPESRRYAVTREHRGRFFGAGDSMAAEPEHQQHHNEDPLETTELARRLRRMEWPPAPPEVKERVLERLIESSRNAPGPDEGRSERN